MLNKVETFYSKEMNTSDFKCQSDSRAKSDQSHGHVFSVRIFSKALQLWSENINVNFSKIIFNVKAIISRTAQTIFFLSLWFEKASLESLTLTLFVSFLFIANISGQTVSVSNK